LPTTIAKLAVEFTNGPGGAVPVTLTSLVVVALTVAVALLLLVLASPGVVAVI
jgi:hypothetical protein